MTAAFGLLATWLDRKLTARLQWRQGPPWFQPLADILKLLGKETFIPEGAVPAIFLGAPLVGLTAVTLISTIIWLPGTSFVGDIIVVLYLLTVPSLMVIIGGSSSRNPLAAIGASREMKLILAYELPFILAVFTIVAKHGSLMLAGISGTAGASWSGFLAFVAAFLVAQAKLSLAPFDIPEAEQEIMAGPYLEYSGPPLAVFKLTRAMLFFVLPAFLVSVFWGGLGPNYLWGLGKCVIIMVLMVLVKNTNPRLRIDHAVRFFWGPVFLIAAAGFILAMVGH